MQKNDDDVEFLTRSELKKEVRKLRLEQEYSQNVAKGYLIGASLVILWLVCYVVYGWFWSPWGFGG